MSMSARIHCGTTALPRRRAPILLGAIIAPVVRGTTATDLCALITTSVMAKERATTATNTPTVPTPLDLLPVPVKRDSMGMGSLAQVFLIIFWGAFW